MSNLFETLGFIEKTEWNWPKSNNSIQEKDIVNIINKYTLDYRSAVDDHLIECLNHPIYGCAPDWMISRISRSLDSRSGNIYQKIANDISNLRKINFKNIPEILGQDGQKIDMDLVVLINEVFFGFEIRSTSNTDGIKSKATLNTLNEYKKSFSNIMGVSEDNIILKIGVGMPLSFTFEDFCKKEASTLIGQVGKENVMFVQDFWNFVCGRDDGYDLVMNEIKELYKRGNITYIEHNEALSKMARQQI